VKSIPPIFHTRVKRVYTVRWQTCLVKVISYEQLKQILESVPGRPRIVSSGNFASPNTLLRAADESIAEFTLHMLNAHPGIPDREGIDYETAFVGEGMRRHPRLTYIPSRLSLVPTLFRDHFTPDLVLLHASTPEGGKVSLGTEVNVLPAAIEAVRAQGGLVIAQLNKQMPYTFGDGEIAEDLIDYAVDVDEALAVKPTSIANETASQIGERIANLVGDGSTLQLGIGGIPDSVIDKLHGRKQLRVYTEMFSDGVLGLSRAGALDESVPITASFVFGGAELYEWLNHNRSVRMVRTETSNDPSLIAKQRQMTSINAALQVDLHDQANASTVRGEIYSGFGGSTDYIVGALHSLGGKSFMALASWHTKAKVSSIVTRLSEPVTSFQHSYVVTEQGVAECFGKSQSQQAFNLINKAAHPDARAELTAYAEATHLL
jgi:acyl-CoA hydrolase